MFCIFCWPPGIAYLEGGDNCFLSHPITFHIYIYNNLVSFSECYFYYIIIAVSRGCKHVFVGGGFCHKKFHFCAYITPEILLLNLRLIDE